MAISTNGIIGVEGLGERQARSGLHSMLARRTTHNPGREDRAHEPEDHQLKNHDHVTTHAANGLQRRRSLLDMEVDR